MLDISSTDKGILIPRVTLTANNSISPITAPADALLIYNTATAGVAPNNVIPGQKSINLVNWIDITTIQGSGNPTTIKEYNYTYTENYIGNIYYRLKQVDYDGQYEYSIIISVEGLSPLSEPCLTSAKAEYPMKKQIIIITVILYKFFIFYFFIDYKLMT